MKVALKELRFSERLTELRSIDPFTVSRYRIAMRSGAVFPRIVVNRETMEIVSGNHTATAMLGEFGEDHAIEVDAKTYRNDVEVIQDFARHNVGHGRPLDGWTQRKIAVALVEAGQSEQDIAKLLNVPVGHLQKWGERTVVVIGRDKERKVMPVKGGVCVPTGRMTQKQYDRHADADIGMSVSDLASQLVERLENGWVDNNDEREVALLGKLRGLLSL
jgi:hypothetical protein